MNRTARALLLMFCALALFLSIGWPVSGEAGDEPQVEALHDAARRGDLTEIRRLLEAGVPVDAGNHYEVTALMYAAGWGHDDVVLELLERGADLEHVDNLYGANAMTWASDRGHTAVMTLLVERGADASEALFSALRSEDPVVVGALVASGKISSEVVSAALSRATLDEQEEIAALLTKAGGKLPPLSTYKIAPERIASYVGTYGFERSPEYKLTLTLEEGILTGHFPGDQAIPLEALDEVRFRQPRSTFFELQMQLEEGKVTGAKLIQANLATPFLFLREDGASGTEGGKAPAVAKAPGTSPTTRETTVAEVPPVKEHLAVPQGVAETNWTGFRGPATAGTAQGRPPLTWNVEDGTHILWKTPIAGRSHASPIVWGDKIFVATAVSSVKDAPFRTGLYGDPDFVEDGATYSWRLLALHRATGEVLWEQVVHEGKPRAKHHIKATQMNATPVTDGRHVVAVMGSEGLVCFGLDGKLLWKNDLGVLSVGWFYDSGFEWGHSSSPILYGDRVIVQVDRAKDPFIAAYALADGKEVWRTSRDNIPSWGTPALLEGPEGMEIVTNGSRKIRGYDADTGKELWSLGPHSEVTVGSVVTGHGLAFAVGDWQPVRAIYAIRAGGRGDLSLAEDEDSSEHIAWHRRRGGTYVPTPLVYGDFFYTVANNGILTAYDAKTGEQIYRARAAGRGGAAFSASPVAAAGRLYLASEDGDVYVVRHDREFELLAKNEMNEIIMATPAVSGDMLLVRTLGNLYAIGERKTAAAEVVEEQGKR